MQNTELKSKIIEDATAQFQKVQADNNQILNDYKQKVIQIKQLKIKRKKELYEEAEQLKAQFIAALTENSQ